MTTLYFHFLCVTTVAYGLKTISKGVYLKNRLIKSFDYGVECSSSSVESENFEEIFKSTCRYKEIEFVEGLNHDATQSLESKFNRTNRLDGQKRWVQELKSLEFTEDINLSSIVNVAKELLYSGIPEQVLELYMECSKILNRGEKAVSAKYSDIEIPVVSDKKLILTTLRAFIAMNDVQGAIGLLQSISRVAIDIDANSKSLFLTDLAEFSAEGLQASLHIYSSMIEKNEKVSSSAYASILKGISVHGLQKSNPENKFLFPMNVTNEKNILTNNPSEYKSLALELVGEYVDGLGVNSTAKKNYKVFNELIRITFRTAVSLAKSFDDKNGNDDIIRTKRSQTQNGIGDVLQIMKRFGLSWNIHIADTIMDECLRIGDLTGVQFVSETMMNNRIWARTTTFNTLLQRYADNGDAESAYNLVYDVMLKNEMTKPNENSWSLLLEACAKSTRGRYYSAQVLSNLREKGIMRKDGWDRLLELCALSGHSYTNVILEMVDEGSQPDEKSILLLLSAFKTTGNIDAAIHLYKLQVSSDIIRRKYILNTSKSGNDMKQDNFKKDSNEYLALFLPPFTRRISIALMEILRDAGRGEMAVEVLRAMTARSIKQKQNTSGVKSKYDIFTNILGPDSTCFALAIEACVTEKNSNLALSIFSDMEKYGLNANRRTYSALVRAFGLRNDVSSALGVFHEMRHNGVEVDVEVLQSILDVCLSNGDHTNFAQACVMLATLAAEGADLQVYAQDILMQTFPDARSLGSALTEMESEIEKDNSNAQIYTYAVGLDIISVLAQACRKNEGCENLKQTLRFLGKMGVRPDKEIMDYFRIPEDPIANSPNSRHYRRQLMPHKARVRSLLDMDFPIAIDTDIGLPDRGFHKNDHAPGGRRDTEPYFETGNDLWSAHASALKAAMKGTDDILDSNPSKYSNDESNDLNDISYKSIPIVDGLNDAFMSLKMESKQDTKTNSDPNKKQKTGERNEVVIGIGIQTSRKDDPFQRPKRRRVERTIAENKANDRIILNKSTRK